MQLGETIATYDVALALRGESGKFEVTSPKGEMYRVTCKPDHSISSLEWSGSGLEAQPFLITKVAEPVLRDSGKSSNTAAIESQPRSAAAPFLLATQDEGANTLSIGPDLLSVNPEGEGSNAEATFIEFCYEETEAKTRQPSVFLYVKTEGSHGRVNRHMLTAPCASFNELDSEIRRLQAQLDEIRSQVKKRFYKTQAVTQAIAAGA